MGISESNRRYPGRWSAKTSEDYVRTSQRIVLSTQDHVADQVRKNHLRHDIVDELSLFDGLIEFLERSLSLQGAILIVNQLCYFATQADDKVNEQENDHNISDMPVQTDVVDTDSDDTTGGYFILESARAKVRRLHFAGFCPARCDPQSLVCSVFGSVVPNPEQYYFVCRCGWPKGGPAAVGSDHLSSSGESESSSSS